jgi:hypothetical protein
MTLVQSLINAIKSAQAGDVIYVPGSPVLSFNGLPTVDVPGGVTILGDRGITGKPATLQKNKSSGGWKDSMLNAAGDSVRVTGLILEGEMLAESEQPLIDEGLYLKGITAFGRRGLVVDNNEIRGWGYAGVFCDHCPTDGRPWIHHNFIHSCQAAGEGYGVNVNYGDLLMEANLLDKNRHSFTGGGQPGECAEVRYNVHRGSGCAQGCAHFDVHECESGGQFAGSEYLIHHNTVLQNPLGVTDKTSAVLHIRENPAKGVYFYNNLINTDWGSGSNYRGWQKPHWFSRDRGSTDAGRVFCGNNKWRGTVYPGNEGILWTS